MHSYGFTLQEINDIHNNKEHMRAHVLLWKTIGSIKDTMAFRYVRDNMPHSFDKYRIGILCTYFEEAVTAMDSLINGFMVSQDGIFKMKMYLKAEYHTLSLYHILKSTSDGIDMTPPFPREVVSGVPGLPISVPANLVTLTSRIMPSCEADDSFTDNWVVSSSLSVKGERGQMPLDNIEKYKTLRELVLEFYGSKVAQKCIGELFDCDIIAALQKLAEESVIVSAEKLKLQTFLDWKLPGKIAMLRFSVKQSYIESVYMNHMADNSFIIHPYAYK